jgi:hypothetical protein
MANGPALGGAPVASPWDPALAIAMAAAGEAVYEEDLLDDLLADLAPGGVELSTVDGPSRQG